MSDIRQAIAEHRLDEFAANFYQEQGLDQPS